MNILIAALELAPYVQNSPAAESIANLAKSLRLLGHEISIAVPRLPAYEEAGLMAARRLSLLELGSGQHGSGQKATIFDAQLPSGATVVMLEVGSARFDAERRLDSQPEAIGAFALAVAALAGDALENGNPFDVIHAHDACAGLALMKLQSSAAAGIGKVLSVHDAARSGEFSASASQALGIPHDRMNSHGFGVGTGLSLLKGLISEADTIVTPSDAYSRQLQSPERYGALSRAFQGIPLVGVIEGVDHALFNPSTDAALTSRYDAPNPANKARNRLAVLRELSLDFETTRPLLFCEDVADGDCALKTVLSALPGLVRNDVLLIISAGSDLRAENERLLEPFAERICWVSDITPQTRRRFLAAADFYLSVQRRNPSGQALLQASRYGAVPIALEVDSVSDIVVDCDAELATGTGLLFSSMTQRSLIAVSGRAVAAYRSQSWRKLLSRVMRQDLAWDRSARRHVQLYRQATAARA